MRVEEKLECEQIETYGPDLPQPSGERPHAVQGPPVTNPEQRSITGSDFQKYFVRFLSQSLWREKETLINVLKDLAEKQTNKQINTLYLRYI